MKIALITDTHFGARNDSIQFLDYYEKFYSGTFFPTLDKEGIDTVIMLGDTFDRRKYINYLTLKRAKEIYFDELSKRKIKTFILVGNHDTTYKNTNEVNSIELLLEDYSNITAISGPKTINVDQHDICMIPWINAENYDISLAEIKNTSATVCCGHFEIEGFAMHRGMPSQEGLKRDIFRKFDLTFSGHYHHKSSSDSIYYLGNPYELTWSDYNDTRGFHILDLDTRNLDFIPNPNVMFHRIVYDDKLESITEITNKAMAGYANTYVKVVVVNKTNPYLFDKFMNNLYNVNPLDITIVEDFTELTEGVDDEMVDQAQDTITILNKYVDTIQDDSIDNTVLKNILQEVYVEALNDETL
jgi:DNA repair exonuclease SbcCD nuclease subunit